MKTVAIKSISMRYFKGIVDLTIDLDKEGNVIKGKNEIGKSSVVDAVMWILFDRDSLGNTTQSFDIKTRKDGEQISGVDHTVRVEFYDGLVLEKKYREKFTGKKDGTQRRASSHETEYTFNGLAMRKSDYESKLGEHLANATQMQMLMRPSFITEEMQWAEVRQLLFELIEDVEKKDVYDKDPDLKKIEDLSDGFAIEEALSREKDRLSTVRKQLNEIPVRLDELNDMIKDPVHPDTQMSEEKVQEAITTAQNAESSNGIDHDLIEELEQEKREVKSKKQAVIDELQAELTERKEEIRTRMSEKEEEVDDLSRQIRNVKSNLNDLLDEKRSFERKVKLSTEEREVRAGQQLIAPDPLEDEALVCPTCGQDLPDADEIVKKHDESLEAFKKKEEEFKAEKAKKLKAIDKELKGYRDSLSDVVLKEKDLKEQVSELEGKRSQVNSELTQINSEIMQATKDHQSKVDEKSAKWDERLNALDANIAEAKTPEPSEEDDEREEWIEELKGYLRGYEAYRSRVKQNEEINAKIKQWKLKQKELSEQLENHEENILLMEKFVTTRAKLIEEKINHKFYNVEWRLFEVQVNGGVKETCVPTYKGVAFKEGVNNAHRIIGGVETIKVIGDHLGLHLPVFIDNAESINRIPMELLDGVQVIPLYVTEDPDLIVEPLDTKV